MGVSKSKKSTISGNMGAASSGKIFNSNTGAALISGVTIGLFNVTSGERFSGQIAQGWVLKTTGSGGRAGRITGETLVCMTSNSGS